MAVSVIHQPNQPMLWAIFLPQIGTILLILLPLLYLNRKNIDLGDKWVWIPLAILVGIGVARVPYVLITGDTIWGLDKEAAHAGYLICMFALYLASRRFGLSIFRVMPAMVILASLGMVVFGIIHPGQRGAGIISYANYDIGAIFLIFCTLISPRQYRWWLSAIALVGLFFTGAEIGLISISIIFLAVLVRRDWSRKMLLPVGALVVTILMCSPFGITYKLYNPTYERISALIQAPFADDTKAVVPTVDVRNFPAGNVTERIALLDKATNLRWTKFSSISPIKPLGYGYNINYFYYPLDEERGKMTAILAKAGVTGGIPHNEFLLIIEQLGPVALVVWLIATGRMVLKSGWTYAWIGFLSLGLLDHELWTVAAPWYWVFAGVCTANPIKDKDYIFRS